jgi:hypothetical protein
MCSYSILCCVPFVWDVCGYCNGCAITVFFVVHLFFGMLVVILLDVQLQYFVLCTVCVGCWWLFYWMCSYSNLFCVPFLCISFALHFHRAVHYFHTLTQNVSVIYNFYKSKAKSPCAFKQEICCTVLVGESDTNQTL